jgi:hypothetical protein
VSERIIIEYGSGIEWMSYPITVAATVSSRELFAETLEAKVREAHEENPRHADADLDVDGIILECFPVKKYLEDGDMCEVYDLDAWFEENELKNSSEARVNRLCGVVDPSP